MKMKQGVQVEFVVDQLNGGQENTVQEEWITRFHSMTESPKRKKEGLVLTKDLGSLIEWKPPDSYSTFSRSIYAPCGGKRGREKEPKGRERERERER